MKLIYSLSFIGAISAYREIPKDTLEELNYEEWKDHHSISYSTVKEDMKRERYFYEMRDFVRHHNRKYKEEHVSYYTSMNRFAAMPNHEFVDKYTQRNKPKPTNSLGEEMEQYVCPFEWSYTNYTQNANVMELVTSVKNQGQCGSCYTFATAASIEGQICKRGLVNCDAWEGISTQQFVDCADNPDLSPYTDDGCGGGWPANVMHYIFDFQYGFESWVDYPYLMNPQNDMVLQEPCNYNSEMSIGSITQCGNMAESGNQDQMCSIVETFGAAAIQMDASGQGFQVYAGGVYAGDPECSADDLDHAITAVGFGTTDGQPTLTVKNSWGMAWGDEGYFYLIRNGENTCGAYTYANFPLGIVGGPADLN